MAAFLFQIALGDFSEDLQFVIPVHRKYINRLFANGVLMSYSVSVNRDMLWCVLHADTEDEANTMVQKFPLHPYFIEVTCSPLLFHGPVPQSMPAISLN
jgi:hypothetical protein